MKINIIILMSILTVTFNPVFGHNCAGHSDENNKKTIKKHSTEKVKLAEKSENTVVVIETSMGTMKAKLYDNRTPITTDNFKKLISEKYYDGIIFHRVIKDFMIQGGCPDGTGRGGPGYKIKDEFHPELKHTKKGLLSMANAGPNTGGSQFFITLKATPWLDNRHAIFGELIDGLDVLEKIGETKTASMDRPVKEVKMNKVYIQK
ncbi:MAG: peptidylprolyl isomerase [Candidatus Neomarinimicrobiota bacterium]|jgi:peptidyl-prolyl cis-trans isomerase A (cyclophilin A)|nr:peptidylprolyl isomerase [Candidatus Neomarinimicrobiota bacterium]